jgi:hypothetical protein
MATENNLSIKDCLGIHTPEPGGYSYFYSNTIKELDLVLSKKGKGVYGKIKFGDWLGEHSRESLDFTESKNRTPCEINPSGIHTRTRFDMVNYAKEQQEPKTSDTSRTPFVNCDTLLTSKY